MFTSLIFIPFFYSAYGDCLNIFREGRKSANPGKSFVFDYSRFCAAFARRAFEKFCLFYGMLRDIIDKNDAEAKMPEKTRPKNCAQKVLCAYLKETGLSEAEAMEIGAPLGGGRAIKCGAILAAQIVLGAKNGKVDKADLYRAGEKNAEFEKTFENMNKSLLCTELKGKHFRSCEGCVEDSKKIIGDMNK